MMLRTKIREFAKASVLVCCLAAMTASAYETDQHHNRDQVVADSTDILNTKVNETIRDISEDWSAGHDEMAFVDEIYGRIGGRHYVDKLERWAMTSPRVERLDTERVNSIYSSYPLWSLRVSTLFGIGKTIRLNDQLVGTDKIGHFISQGRKFYKRYLQSGSETEASKRSVLTEKAIFGQVTTGSFSNADLVANFEGYRFYRSLFEDEFIPGKPAILKWTDGRWVVQRKFDWADHVNEFWDEALNPNQYTLLPSIYVRRQLVEMCDAFWAQPELFIAADRAELSERYAHIGLIENSELRMDVLCPTEASKLVPVASAAIRAYD
jgi:hypothetical protein